MTNVVAVFLTLLVPATAAPRVAVIVSGQDVVAADADVLQESKGAGCWSLTKAVTFLYLPYPAVCRSWLTMLLRLVCIPRSSRARAVHLPCASLCLKDLEGFVGIQSYQ